MRGLIRQRMAIRSDLLARYVAIGWFLNAAFVGCGGQPGSGSNGDTTPDGAAPTIIAKFPTDTQTSVPVNTVIAITFSKAIDTRRISLVDAEITLSQAISGTIRPVQKSSRWEAASNTLFVRPTTLLEADRHYTVRITNNIVDTAGNRLDTGSPDGTLVWRFTTGDTFDGEKPIWNPSKKALAVVDRYDMITVCWWNDDPATTVTACTGAGAPPTAPAAYDPPTNESTELIYTVQYRRSVDADFTSVPAQDLGARRLTLSNLIASTEYQIQVRVSDVAANQADEVVVANTAKTPPAGRLYVANQTVHNLSMLSDVGQAKGNENAAVVTVDKTQLIVPTGVAVDPGDPDAPGDPSRPGYVYVANTNSNMIAAYKLDQQKTGEYGIGHNVEPAWTIKGTFDSTDITGLCGPSTLRFERERTLGKSYLYVTNSFAAGTRYSPGRCLPDSILVFDVSETPQSSNEKPLAVIRDSRLWAPLAFAVDETHNLVYVANRDYLDPSVGVMSNAGGTIDVFAFTRNPVTGIIELAQGPHRSFWGSAGGACTAADSTIPNRLCGPSAAVYNPGTDRLIVVNRGKNNLLVFSDVSKPETVGQRSPKVIAGLNTGLDNARPVGIFLDPQLPDNTPPGPRVYVTTDTEQSVLIFDLGDLINSTSSNITPRRIIKGSRTMLGQPAKPVGDTPAQSNGPIAVAVVRNGSKDEAYVVTSGSFHPDANLNPIPSLAIFDVSEGRDPPSTAINRVTNTPPDRVVVNPLLGPAGMALDLVSQRLYVASFYSNMILVYDEPKAFVTGAKEPTRIIAGPRTMLDHPVSLFFRRDSFERGALYVVNQSSHSVAVFNDGDGTLSGDVAPNRYVGAPEGTDPKPLTDPFDATKNRTEMVFPTGLAIDPDEDILYVSNRDAEKFQDLAGRRIVAFKGASTIGAIDPAINENNNVTPTWKIEGDPPPSNCNLFCPPPTDKTTLKRPTGLFLIPDGDDTVAEDRLVVTNREKGTVLIFRGVSDLVSRRPVDQNIAPTWTIAHAAMGIPFGLTFNAATKDLYVSDLLDRILAFNLSTLSLDKPVPSLEPRLIMGSSTGLRTPHGMALDPQLDPQN